jgi:hypothetical protein
MNPQHTLQFRRKRKALLVLPIMVITFAALGFYAMGGGKDQATGKQVTVSPGLNTSLPGAAFDKHEKPKDKLSFYDQAQLDSAKQQSANNNPVLHQFGFKTGSDNPKPPANNTSLTPAYTDPTIAKINQKLADINQQISQPQPVTNSVVNTPVPGKTATDKETAAQISKLEMMMKSMNAGQGSDPQMQQLSKILAQIEAIQHPELVKADAQKVAVTTDNPFKAIAAVIDGNQKVLQGGAVKLKLNDSLTVKGQLIPKGTLVFGTANITNQRLLLEIKNIRLGQAIIPVNLTAYAEDGMPGVPAPEAEIAGAAGNGADNALESMQFLSMDQSLATQAASGGIQAAKGLFSKKVRRIKVKLKNGYPVLLRNNRN